jgi:1,4-dihydroxy-2-naphthoate polyprenyltransferase
VARETAESPLAPVGALVRFGLYVEVGKLKIFELWLGIPIAWSLLSAEQRGAPETLLIMAMALLVIAGTAAASLSLDDVAGLRDGVDLANHADTDRYGVNKPLLDGRLSEQQALKFVYLLVGIATAAAFILFALVWPVSGWLAALTFGILVIPLNYSFGLKLSYHGLGELLTMSAIAGSVLLPFGAVMGSLPAAVLLQSLLAGLWMLHIAVFSNTQDREGDRKARRMTIAAILSKRGNYVFIVALFALTWSLTAYGLFTGLLSEPAGLALVPLWVLQIRQIWLGVFQEKWLKARLLGFWLYRYALAALFVANLIGDRSPL